MFNRICVAFRYKALIRNFWLIKQALYFDRYQKLLAPGSDPLRDPRLKEYLSMEMGAPVVVSHESKAIDVGNSGVQ